MRYLLLTLEYPPFKGGVAHYYSHLVKYFPEKITVVDNAEKKLLAGNRKFLQWWPALKTLKSVLSKDKDTYILIGQILPLGTAAWLLSFVYKFNYGVFLHGYDLNSGRSQPRKRWLVKAILQRADKIICANSYTEKEVRTFLSYPVIPAQAGIQTVDNNGRKLDCRQSLPHATTRDGNNIICVNPGIEGETIAYNEAAIEALKKRYNLEHKTVLLSVGRLVKRKGVDMVLEALNLALKRAPELVFVIIGQGDEEVNLRAKIANLGLEKNTLILTDVDDEAKMHWYKLCDIFIMTARQIGADLEGFGIVYLEAGLAGKPVIAGRSGGVADAVEDNVNGLLVDPTKPEEIAEAIIKLAKYEKLRERLGDAGRQRAIEMFNWERQAKKIYEFMNL